MEVGIIYSYTLTRYFKRDKFGKNEWQWVNYFKKHPLKKKSNYEYDTKYRTKLSEQSLQYLCRFIKTYDREFISDTNFIYAGKLTENKKAGKKTATAVKKSILETVTT